MRNFLTFNTGLVRVLGRILVWMVASQPERADTETASIDADFAGLPLMHFGRSISCVPISLCYPNAAVPKMDDTNALARLYPSNVTRSRRAEFTAACTSPMPPAMQCSRCGRQRGRAATSFGSAFAAVRCDFVSGFAFHGNAGNIIDGYVDANGIRYDGGAPVIPRSKVFSIWPTRDSTGQSIAQYQLSVEALDARWSLGVERTFLHRWRPRDRSLRCSDRHEWVERTARHPDVAE